MSSTTLVPHSQIKEYIALTKPRITLLVLITAYGGMWLASSGPPELGLTLVALAGIGLASAASAVLNNYFDRDIDQIMRRTQQRSLPSNRIHPRAALGFGLFLHLTAFVILLVGVNGLSAWLTLATVFVYVVVYTLWLKRRSAFCTAIGGIAGALPPVIGWATVTGHIGEPAIILFAIMFLWQPPHFWALAILRVDEYRDANVLILPVTKGALVTTRRMLWYTLALLPASLLLYFRDWAGDIYFYAALLMGCLYIGINIRSALDPQNASLLRKNFMLSIAYVFALFLTMLL